MNTPQQQGMTSQGVMQPQQPGMMTSQQQPGMTSQPGFMSNIGGQPMMSQGNAPRPGMMQVGRKDQANR